MEDLKSLKERQLHLDLMTLAQKKGLSKEGMGLIEGHLRLGTDKNKLLEDALIVTKVANTASGRNKVEMALWLNKILTGLLLGAEGLESTTETVQAEKKKLWALFYAVESLGWTWSSPKHLIARELLNLGCSKPEKQRLMHDGGDPAVLQIVLNHSDSDGAWEKILKLLAQPEPTFHKPYQLKAALESPHLTAIRLEMVYEVWMGLKRDDSLFKELLALLNKSTGDLWAKTLSLLGEMTEGFKEGGQKKLAIWKLLGDLKRSGVPSGIKALDLKPLIGSPNREARELGIKLAGRLNKGLHESQNKSMTRPA